MVTMTSVGSGDLRGGHYMARQRLPDRRHTWRQKVTIHDRDSGRHVFYIDFGEYEDSRLAEVFVTCHRTGSFVRGTLDALARGLSLALQCGTSPHELARSLLGQCYPPEGRVAAEGSALDGTAVSSVADYIGREILSCYGEDGRLRTVRQKPLDPPEDRVAGDYEPGSGV